MYKFISLVALSFLFILGITATPLPNCDVGVFTQKTEYTSVVNYDFANLSIDAKHLRQSEQTSVNNVISFSNISKTSGYGENADFKVGWQNSQAIYYNKTSSAEKITYVSIIKADLKVGWRINIS